MAPHMDPNFEEGVVECGACKGPVRILDKKDVRISRPGNGELERYSSDVKCLGTKHGRGKNCAAYDQIRTWNFPKDEDGNINWDIRARYSQPKKGQQQSCSGCKGKQGSSDCSLVELVRTEDPDVRFPDGEQLKYIAAMVQAFCVKCCIKYSPLDDDGKLVDCERATHRTGKRALKWIGQGGRDGGADDDLLDLQLPEEGAALANARGRAAERRDGDDGGAGPARQTSDVGATRLVIIFEDSVDGVGVKRTLHRMPFTDAGRSVVKAPQSRDDGHPNVLRYWVSLFSDWMQIDPLTPSAEAGTNVWLVPAPSDGPAAICLLAAEVDPLPPSLCRSDSDKLRPALELASLPSARPEGAAFAPAVPAGATGGSVLGAGARPSLTTTSSAASVPGGRRKASSPPLDATVASTPAKKPRSDQKSSSSAPASRPPASRGRAADRVVVGDMHPFLFSVCSKPTSAKMPNSYGLSQYTIKVADDQRNSLPENLAAAGIGWDFWCAALRFYRGQIVEHVPDYVKIETPPYRTAFGVLPSLHSLTWADAVQRKWSRADFVALPPAVAAQQAPSTSGTADIKPSAAAIRALGLDLDSSSKSSDDEDDDGDDDDGDNDGDDDGGDDGGDDSTSAHAEEWHGFGSDFESDIETVSREDRFGDGQRSSTPEHAQVRAPRQRSPIAISSDHEGDLTVRAAGAGAHAPHPKPMVLELSD